MSGRSSSPATRPIGEYRVVDFAPRSPDRAAQDSVLQPFR